MTGGTMAPGSDVSHVLPLDAYEVSCRVRAGGTSPALVKARVGPFEGLHPEDVSRRPKKWFPRSCRVGLQRTSDWWQD